MRKHVLCAPEFHNEFWQFFYLLNNFTRINHCKFKKPFQTLSQLPSIYSTQGIFQFSFIFNVKKCAPNSIKFGNNSKI